ncbi:MAG: glycosyltransferase family 2 protein, partial [Planctomycetaceae bacterium]|nr:glycosyltransferase family 2 protein [Planctomycetaceae bacterium]
MTSDLQHSSERPRLSVVIPAHNEEANIVWCVDELLACVTDEHGIRTEVIVVNDNSTDATESRLLDLARRRPQVRVIRRSPPAGFGRAVRTGLEFATGDVVVIYMADRSDHPIDALNYYREILNGHDCVFGSRFMPGAVVHHYPRLKLVVNRIVNRAIQWMFWTDLNDLTNAFKAYRR